LIIFAYLYRIYNSEGIAFVDGLIGPLNFGVGGFLIPDIDVDISNDESRSVIGEIAAPSTLLVKIHFEF